MKKALVITGVTAVVATYMIVKTHRNIVLNKQEREKLKEDALRELNELFE